MDHDDVGEQHEPVAPGDADLVLRTRSGDRGAFGELWRRHYRAGVTVARNMTSSLDPDDLVQEAYTRIYQSIVAGGGPTGSFRAYLFTSIRNTAAAWGRARRETAYDELDGVEDPAAGEHASEAALDRGLTHRAFRSLPTRWQEVLWYSEIEQMKPAEIAPLLGMKATAVAQLTFRAREGLREAWIQAHLQSVEDGSDCQWAIERLGAYSRRNLGRRDHAKVDAHLAACVRCSIVASEAKEVSSRLALVLLPLALGAAGTAGYLATVQGGSAPLVALAAMPQAIVQGGGAAALPAGVTGGAAGGGAAGGSAAGGGAVVGTGAVAGTGAAAGVGTGAAAGAAGAGAGAAAVSTIAAGGTALAGIGAASGLAAASLVVVGGVVAAAVALPPVASDPVPSPSSISDVAPAAPPLVPETDADTGLRLPASSGPGPADLPAAPDGGAGAGGTTTSTGAGSATDGAVADAGTTPSGGGQGSTGGQGNGSGGGQGNAGGQGDSTTGGSDDKDKSNGNAGSGNNGNAGDKGDTGNAGGGTPTNGTGGGNGGTTGNGGSTGTGTPTNGTGNGNGGNTGAGNGAANGSTDNNGGGNGKGKGAVNVPQSLGVTPSTSDPSETAAPDEGTNGKRTGQVRAQSGPHA